MSLMDTDKKSDFLNLLRLAGDIRDYLRPGVQAMWQIIKLVPSPVVRQELIEQACRMQAEQLIKSERLLAADPDKRIGVRKVLVSAARGLFKDLAKADGL